MALYGKFPYEIDGGNIMSTVTKRLDMRVDSNTKRLVELASAATGSSVTEFVVSLIHERAPEILRRQKELILTVDEYDRFMQITNDNTLNPSPYILDAAKRLDQQGF